MLRCPRWPRSKSSFTAVRFSAVTPGIQRSDALTLLHKTIALVPRALPTRATSTVTSPAESLDFWNDVLSNQYQELNSADQRPARVAVCSADQWSNSEDLVTALLDEPLTSNASTSEQLRDRWKTHTLDTLTITSRNQPSSATDSFSSPSSYLRQFDVPIEITELRPLPTHQKNTTFEASVTRTLLTADASIVVCNPLTTQLDSLLKHPFLRNPKTILVLTCDASTEIADLIRSKFTQACKDIHHQRPYRGPHIVFANPSRAVAANAVLKADSKSAIAIQRYQDNFVDSRVSEVTEFLRRRLTSTDSKPNSVQTESSIATIHAAISSTYASLRRSRDEVESVFTDVGQLTDRMEEARARVHGEVFRSSTDGKNAVDEAFQRATKDIRPVLDRLTWWRLPWTVDDTSATIASALERVFCLDLEKRLILHAGRLSVLQAELTSSTFKLLSKYTDTPFHSAVLTNSLKQLASSPSYPITPSTLTQPISTRQAQIIQHPANQLHLAGQKALLAMAGSTITGASVGWAGWVGWLVGNGDGLLGVIGMDAGTSMGVGALIGLGGIRWGIRKWEKAKRRWFEDWKRVGDGLERDLTASLDRTLKDNVFVVADAGSKHLLETARKRKQEIAVVKDDADMLLDNLEEAYQRQ